MFSPLQFTDLNLGQRVFGFLVIALDDFDVRRFPQNAAHGHDGSVIAQQGAQVIWRNDGGAVGKISPTNQYNERPDQPGTEFFEDENEGEDKK